MEKTKIYSDIAVAATASTIGIALGWLGRSACERARTARAHFSKQWPIDIHIETDVRIIWPNMPPWISAPVFIPRALDVAHFTEHPKDPLEFHKWALDNLSGQPSDTQTVQLTVRSKSTCEVIFDTVRIHVEAYDPGPGTVLSMPVGGASVESRRFDIELSDFAPNVTLLDLGSMRVQEFSAVIKPGDPLRINLDAHPSQYGTSRAYKWFAYLDMLVDGKRKSIRVPHSKSEDFLLADSKHYDTYQYSPQGWLMNDS